MNWAGIIGGVLFAGLLVLAGQDLVQRIQEHNELEQPLPSARPVTGSTGASGPTGPLRAGEDAQRSRLRPGSATTLQLAYTATGLWLRDRRGGPDPADALAMRIADQHDSVAGAQDASTVFIAGCCPAGEPLVRVELREAAPPTVDRADWRGVSDVDLSLRSGELAFAPSGTADASAVLRVPKGRYRVRVSAAARTTEFFEVVLWPTDGPRPLEVHKEISDA